MSSRSLKVAPEHLERVKAALQRNSYPSKQALATEVGKSKSTIDKFFSGKPIDRLNFIEICEKLDLEWRSVAEIQNAGEDGDLYVKRPPVESQCLESLTQIGSLIRIKAPERMGKTSLMNWLLKQAQQQGYQTVYYNLLQPRQTVIRDLDQLLKSLCTSVKRQLDLSQVVSEAWDEDLGSNDNCTFYFEDHVLPNLESPLVLALDNVDRMFPYGEPAGDFLGLLRSWHEVTKNQEIWKKLRLIIAHSTGDYPKLNYDSSPFNVGLPVELPEFTPEQTQELANRNQLNLTNGQLEPLQAIVGGHPYLLQEAFSQLKAYPDVTVGELLQDAATNAGLYHRYLGELNEALQQNPELADAMKQVVEAGEPVTLADRLTFKLDSLGLVRKQGDVIAPRCELYRLYF